MKKLLYIATGILIIDFIAFFAPIITNWSLTVHQLTDPEGGIVAIIELIVVFAIFSVFGAMLFKAINEKEKTSAIYIQQSIVAFLILLLTIVILFLKLK